MSRVSVELIDAVRKTIVKLKKGAPYQWGHMGACNCGNLAQELIQLTKEEIHRFAMEKSGDWNDQLIDYCPDSGYPMDLMIGKMLEKGLKINDLRHLEKLSDPNILRNLPSTKSRNLEKNILSDVILYFETWLEMLENQWIEKSVDSDVIMLQKNNLDKVFA
ncbi:hypothetical protein [Cognataquiflexum rubidum]|uniref:hypothetical protein n=1 Tax=Cognataquiflexum rubidum TaxID=2922273 RepID=UPI001F13E95B|nr:hypothetical protein [Cognataquiflexum rubidum]MCH6234440.1 hypothetical protein [Cognataquiflexum rubidum]